MLHFILNSLHNAKYKITLNIQLLFQVAEKILLTPSCQEGHKKEMQTFNGLILWETTFKVKITQ